MPLYLCNARAGAISADAKAAIADDITRIHCDITAAPPTFVHAFFFDEGPAPEIGDRTVVLHGNIRAGRTDAQKQDLIDQMCAAVSARTGISRRQIAMTTADVPASWVMEGGDILPEPGEEEAWLKAHEAKAAQARP